MEFKGLESSPKLMELIRPLQLDDMIRLGRLNDGGYVISARCLNVTRHLISGGYGNDWSFEKSFLQKSNLKSVIILDYSINYRILAFSIIREIRNGIKQLKFPKRLIFCFKDLIKFILLRLNPKVSYLCEKLIGFDDVSDSRGMSLERLFSGINSPNGIFLKIDIEGSEYEVLDKLDLFSESLVGAVIEFHEVDSNNMHFMKLIQKLKQFFYIVNVHFNNYSMTNAQGFPTAIEISFIHKRFVSENLRNASIIPSRLDQPNNPKVVDFSYAYSDA
jgi:hypothetical protein